jgi:1-acyl-sn-glycerol-3-phosphate acyltransferase
VVENAVSSPLPVSSIEPAPASAQEPATRTPIVSDTNVAVTRHLALETVNGDAPRSFVQRFCKAGLNVVLSVTTDLEVDGLDWFPTHGPAVLAVNHLSALDVPLALAILPRPVVMLAKDDLRQWRIFDWLLTDVGRAIYVKRGEGDEGALAQALEVLKAGGIVALGPEGHRSPGGLTQAHTGVGYLAARAGVPVVPMAAWGQERLGQSWRRLRRAPVRVRFGPPLVFATAAPGGGELREYSDAVMRAIAKQLPAEYRGVYGG